MKLDKYQKCGNIISQTPLLSSYTIQILTVDNTEGYSKSTEPIDAVNILPLARFEPTIYGPQSVKNSHNDEVVIVKVLP